MIVYFLLIIAFSYFYATIQFNPIEIANNLKKNGGFIPGFRPGKPTADFILKVLNKITLFGALYLASWPSCRCIVGIDGQVAPSPSAARPSSSWSVLRLRPSRAWRPRC